MLSFWWLWNSWRFYLLYDLPYYYIVASRILWNVIKKTGFLRFAHKYFLKTLLLYFCTFSTFTSIINSLILIACHLFIALFWHHRLMLTWAPVWINGWKQIFYQQNLTFCFINCLFTVEPSNMTRVIQKLVLSDPFYIKKKDRNSEQASVQEWENWKWGNLFLFSFSSILIPDVIQIGNTIDLGSI